MRIRAPGKLLLTGAYAVLRGAPAIVIAVNRYVYVESGTSAVDTHELYDGDRKLGLGSSAATAVARLACEAALDGENLDDALVRDRIFRTARAAHAAEQSGGSGVDVAACTFGGVLHYTMEGGARPVRLPPGLVLKAYWSGTSARTSDLRASVDALQARDAIRHDAAMDLLASGASAGARAVGLDDAAALVTAANVTLDGLMTLGTSAGVPIVPESFARLAVRARGEGGAFLPSGAGGGDVALLLSGEQPSAAFSDAARDAGFTPLAIAVDERGVCVC